MTTATTPITNPNVTRSRLVLEIASEMAGGAARRRGAGLYFAHGGA